MENKVTITKPIDFMIRHLKTIQWILTVLLYVCLVFSCVLILRTTLPQAHELAARMGLLAMVGFCILILGSAIDQREYDISDVLFMGMLFVGFVGVTVDTLSYTVDGNPAYAYINNILIFVSYIVACLLMSLFWMYQRSVINIHTYRKWHTVVVGLTLVNLGYIFLAAITGYLYVVDAYGFYVPGEGRKWLIIYPVVMMVLCMVTDLRQKASRRGQLAQISIIFPMIVTATSLFWANGSLEYVIYFFEFVLLYVAIQMKKSVQMANQQKLLSEQKQELLENQTQMMISQIQPHFVYNTLTAIYQLCTTDVELAQKTILDFSDYLRVNLDSIQYRKPIPFEKELEHTKIYLSIEKIRFGDILHVEYDITYKEFSLPALTLQPLVENAVKYGIRSSETGGTITISAKREGRYIYVSVHDNGKGFDPQKLPDDGRSHVGIMNTRNRLKLICDGKLNITSSREEGTTAMIIIEDKN